MSVTHTIVALLLVLSMPLAQAPTETIRQPKQYTIEQFLNTTSISGASFSADESRILFSSNKTGIWNAYTVPVGGGCVDANHVVHHRFHLRRFVLPQR